MTVRVGFLGLGEIGAQMALNIAAAGFPIQVYDTNLRATQAILLDGLPSIATDAATLAAASDVVFAMLPSEIEVADAALGKTGVVNGMKPGGVFVDLSCSAPAAAQTIARRLSAQGIDMLEAGVLGNRNDARARRLRLLVGGDAAAFGRAEPVFKAMAAEVHHVGGFGTGQVAKLLATALEAAGLTMALEGLIAAKRFGLKPEEVLAGATVALGPSAVNTLVGDQVLAGKFDSGRALRFIVRDLDAATKLAQSVDAPVLLLAQLRETWATASRQLGSGDDQTKIVRWLEQVAKTSLR
ncbi:MAG: hypothetical protein FJX65_17165 [Alphaproteobacteria bacterium]|nr:hypothetical protein [Alphaproteobacteria bacterium]